MQHSGAARGEDRKTQSAQRDVENQCAHPGGRAEQTADDQHRQRLERHRHRSEGQRHHDLRRHRHQQRAQRYRPGRAGDS